MTCRIAVQLSSRRAHLAAANILLPSGIVPCKSLVGSPNPSGTGAAAFTWDRQPTLLQPEPGPSQEMAPRAVPPSPPQQRSLLQPPSRVQGPQGASPGGSQPYRCWRWWGTPRGATLLCGDHRESAATIMDQRPHALCWPRAAAVTRTEQGPVGLQGLCMILFSPPSLHPRQTHAMEANHMPPQRSSPFICTNPLICRPSSSSPQRSSDKSRRGAENCTAAACPVQRGQRRLPQRSHHPRAPRRCTGESGQQRGQAGGPCPHLPNGDQKE